MVEWCRLIVDDTQIRVDDFWGFSVFDRKAYE